MSDEYDWAKDDAYMLMKHLGQGLHNDWIEEDRECECGWQGQVEILVPHGEGRWFWDCPGCAYEYEQAPEVLTPSE